MSNRKIIVIADAHLGVNTDDSKRFIDFIRTIDPHKEELLLLGDLFHIWGGPKRYHTAMIAQVLNILNEFHEQQGKIGFVVGNRDFFFPNTTTYTPEYHLPFDLIANDFADISFNGHRLIATHGDLVNTQDKRYLRWRKIGRSRLFSLFVRSIPKKKIEKFMYYMEEKMRQTNLSFRLAFPQKEWENFLQRIQQQFQPKMLLAGHFHPRQIIATSYQDMEAIVVPAWQGDQYYLEIDGALDWQLKQWTGKR